MAKIDFPNNPVVNEIFEAPNGQTWKWDGKSWNSISASNLSGIDVSEFQLKNQLQGTVIGDLLPLGDETIDLGSPTKRFKDLYLSGNSLTIGTSVLSVDSSGDVFVDLNGTGSLVKLSVSDISELSDDTGILDSAGGGGGGGGISLTDLSVGAEGIPAGDGSLSYNNISGIFTYTPPDLSSYLTSYTETDPVFSASDAAGILAADITNWNTAHGWGDHSVAGYLTSYTETSTLDDVITRGHLTTQTAVIPFYYADQSSFPDATSYHGAIAHSHADGAMYFAHGGNWVKLANDGSAGVETDPVFSASAAAGILAGDITNWNTAHGWGDHSAAGYLTSYTETDPVFSASDAAGITNIDIAKWDAAHGWGDHSSAGYLTSYTETDPVFSASAAAGILAGDITNWDTAYGWGDHSSAGYLTSETSHADVLVDGDFNSSGIMVRGTNAGDYNVIVDSSSNWNTAYGWGDHSSAGYAASTDITDLQNQIDNITGADSALDTFQELITYIRGLDSAQDLSLINDVADLKSDSSNWNTAYGWGDHSAAGYLTSYTETDPVFSASAAAGILAGDITNWNTAHGWGDHSAAGYLTSVTASDIGLGNVDNTSDLDKPISTATQAALDDKVDSSDVLTPVDSQNKIVTQTDISALGGGDMLQSVYDSNNDGKVDSADNADTVGGFTVGKNVPPDAVFTDTVYTDSALDIHLNVSSANDGQVLSWDSAGDSYVWVDNPAPTGDSNRVVYDLTDPANSVILDAGDGINPATYKGDVIDNSNNVIVDISSASATFTGTLLGSVAGNSTTPDGNHVILDVGTDGTNGTLDITNITADGTVDFTGATVLGLDSAGYATSSDISDLQLQIDNIAGSDSALDTFTELIAYIRELEATDSAGELSLIQDIADLQTNALVDGDFDSAGLMVTDGNGNYSSIFDNSFHWNQAHSWGDHSAAGYLTSETSHADVLVDSDFDSAGLMVRGDSAGDYSVITDNSSNWNTAYGWGDHSIAGYPKIEISDSAPSNPSVGDLWWNSNEGNLKIYYGNATDTAGDDIWVDASVAGYSGGSGGSSSSITDGTSSVSFDSANDVVIDTDLNVNAINLSGHIIPTQNAAYDLGSAEYKIRHLYLSNNSVYFGSENDSAGEMVQLTKSNVQRSVEIYNVGDDLNNDPLNPNPLTVPPQPTDPGRKGDIRTIGGYAYICIQDDQWVRFALEETW